MSDGPPRRFTRRIESFVCFQCGSRVEGTGYTNHCPHCLWSSHVDINPGDRANPCRGRMEPVGLSLDHGEKIIHHECKSCGARTRVRAALDDCFSEMIKLPVF